MDTQALTNMRGCTMANFLCMWCEEFDDQLREGDANEGLDEGSNDKDGGA